MMCLGHLRATPAAVTVDTKIMVPPMAIAAPMVSTGIPGANAARTRLAKRQRVRVRALTCAARSRVCVLF